MKNASALRRFLSLYRPHRGWLMLSILLACTTLLAQIGLLAVSGWFIAAMGIAGAAGASINYFTPAAIIRALAMLRTGGRYGERLLTHDTTLRMTAHFRHWFYSCIEPLSPSLTGEWRSAELFSRLRGDIDRLERFFLQAFLPAIVSAITLCVAALVLLWIHPPLALSELSLLLLAGIVVPCFQQRSVRKAQHSIVTGHAALRRDATEILQSAGELQVYGQLATRLQGFDEAASAIVSQERTVWRSDAVAQGMHIVLMGCAMLCGFLLCLPLVRDGTMPLAYMAMVPLFCLACFDTVAGLPAVFQALPSARLAAERVFEWVDRAAALPAYGTGRINSDTQLLACSLPALPPRLAQPVSFTLQRGESLLIQGPSGVGKSSLAAYITGLLPLTSGSITLDGVEVRDCHPALWMEAFSVAEQSPYIFTGTVRDNLLLARPGASEEQMLEVCTLVQFPLSGFAQGLDHPIGEHGETLSGGQVRRLSLARALLKPSAWLVLDEPTEGLDMLQAQQVMRSITGWARDQGRGLIVITHQSSLVPLCNKVLRIGC